MKGRIKGLSGDRPVSLFSPSLFSYFSSDNVFFLDNVFFPWTMLSCWVDLSRGGSGYSVLARSQKFSSGEKSDTDF